MDALAVHKSVLALFAEILDYPKPGVARRARECQEALAGVSTEAAAHMATFCNSLETLSPSRREEVYTSTFDLGTSCHPYVGYHLFGERYERSVFLVELKSRYRAGGFADSGNDLPDRLSTLLRFLFASADEESSREIIREGVLPALDKMLNPGTEDMASVPAGSPCLMGCGATTEEDTLAASGPESREAAGLALDPALPAISAKLVPYPDTGAGIQARSRRSESLYRHALEALRIVLKSTAPENVEPVTSNQGGKANG